MLALESRFNVWRRSNPPFRKRILLYFETELADKWGTNSESDSFSKPYIK